MKIRSSKGDLIFVFKRLEKPTKHQYSLVKAGDLSKPYLVLNNKLFKNLLITLHR